MSPLVRFILLRLLLVPLTLLVVTATLMALLTAVPPEVRAMLYLPKRILEGTYAMDMDQLRQVTERYIQKYHMEDPFPVQYAYWVGSVLTNGGGYSPSVKGDVFNALLRRTPVTAELTLYSLLLFIPLGVVSGLRAGWRPGGPTRSEIIRAISSTGRALPVPTLSAWTFTLAVVAPLESVTLPVSVP